MGNFFDFLRTSFFHVAPILVAGAIAAAIMAERTRALFITYPIKDSAGFFDKIRDLIVMGKLGEAVALCDRFPLKPAAQVTKQALLRANQPESLIENGLQIAVADSMTNIQKRTTFLATIANVSTLLGLLGTIAGLIQSFEAVGHADPQQKAALLAAGISQAMNATMLGLGVAIPCMIAFSFLMNRTNHLVSEVESAGIRALDILKQRYYAAEVDAFEQDTAASDDDVQNGHAKKTSNGATLRRVA